jgi:hypothetical protein
MSSRRVKDRARDISAAGAMLVLLGVQMVERARTRRRARAAKRRP